MSYKCVRFHMFDMGDEGFRFYGNSSLAQDYVVNHDKHVKLVQRNVQLISN